MEIKVVQDAKSIEADILVVNKFEDENTTNELANKYAVEQDNFKGKFGENYIGYVKKGKKSENPVLSDAGKGALTGNFVKEESVEIPAADEAKPEKPADSAENVNGKEAG